MQAARERSHFRSKDATNRVTSKTKSAINLVTWFSVFINSSFYHGNNIQGNGK